MSDIGDWGFQGPSKRGLDMPRGSAVPLGPAGRLRLRYNEVTGSLQASIDNGPYADVSGAIPVGPGIVNIYSKGDLPVPVAGVITLDSSRVYIFRDIVDLGTDRIDVNGAKVRGEDNEKTGVTTDNAGAAIFSTNGGRVVQMYVENPIGSAFDLAGPEVIVAETLVDNAVSVGRIGSCLLGFQIFRIAARNVEDGLDIDGICNGGGVLFSSFLAAPGAASFVGLNFTANCDVEFFRCLGSNFLTSNASDRAFNLDPAASLGVTEPGFFAHNGLQGPGSPFTAAADQSDIRWFFNENGGIPDSSFGGNITFMGNLTPTSIVAAGVYYPIGNGTTSPPHVAFSLSADSERFSLQGAFPNQSIQYDGLREETFLLEGDVTFERSGGGTPAYSFQLTHNGVALTGSRRSMFASATTVYLHIRAIIRGATGDNFSMQVANLTNTTDVEVQSANVTLTRLS